MPYNYDFSDLQNIHETEIHLGGWIDPIFIEYGLGMYQTTPSYFWRVKGTQHTFVIPVLRMNFLSQGNYNEHFKEVLQKFREDYIQWKEEGFSTDWGVEYQKQFSRFIA